MGEPAALGLYELDSTAGMQHDVDGTLGAEIRRQDHVARKLSAAAGRDRAGAAAATTNHFTASILDARLQRTSRRAFSCFAAASTPLLLRRR
jgi:hypothetical protein